MKHKQNRISKLQNLQRMNLYYLCRCCCS